MFTKPLKTRAYPLTESLKNRAYLLVLTLGDAFYAKVKGVLSKIFLKAQPPDPFFSFHGDIFTIKLYVSTCKSSFGDHAHL